MFTVIIAEKKHFEAIEHNSLYFKPFLDRSPEEIVFCEWIPGGTTLYECVPDLISAVGRHKEWRAVILNEDSRTLSRNPYDVIDFHRIHECEEKYRLINPYEAEDEDGIFAIPSSEEDSDEERVVTPEQFEAWKDECNKNCDALLDAKKEIFREALSLPLQRLATCLCYVREEPGQSSRSHRMTDIEDYVSEQLNPTSFENYLEDLTHQLHLREEQLKNELRKECIEAMLPADAPARRLGSMGIVLPTEVLCFAERTTETSFFDPQIYWENHNVFEYSAFVIRNMYFDKMQFMVSDILPKTHLNYRYDRIRFLYNLLIVATNEIPTGVIAPRRLYCIESENNEKTLKNIASAYVQKLDNTIEVVDGQIEKIKKEIPGELTDDQAEKLFCAKVNVPVSFSSDFSEDDIYSNEKEFGYFTDDPHANEAITWHDQYSRSNDALEKLVKQPRRSLKKAVDHMDGECEVDYNLIRALNSFQMDDVLEYTESAEDEMISSKIINIFDLSSFRKELETENKKVKNVIGKRMKKKTVLILSVICLALLFCSFLPFLLSNRGNAATFSTALVMSALALGVLLVVMIITVILLRLPLKKALRRYNGVASDIVEKVKDAMDRYSKYLSAICNIRRGYRVMNFSANNIDKYDRNIRTRQKHKIDIEKKRAIVIDAYGDFIDSDAEPDDTATKPYEFNFGDEKAEYRYDPPYLPEDCVTIEYLETGNKITLTSDFVTRISVRMEEIYDQ